MLLFFHFQLFVSKSLLGFSEWVEEADKEKSGGLCDAQKQYHRPHFKYSFYNAEAQVEYREAPKGIAQRDFRLRKFFFADL
jgi:hypothetical protein